MLTLLPPVEAAYRVDPASRAAIHREGNVHTRCRICGLVIGKGHLEGAAQGGLCHWCAAEDSQSFRAKYRGGRK